MGLVTWGGVLWQLRKAAGPVLFVERQIALGIGKFKCATVAEAEMTAAANSPEGQVPLSR